MNKKWFSDILSTFDLGSFIFNIYCYILISFLILPIPFWILLGLEWLLLS